MLSDMTDPSESALSRRVGGFTLLAASAALIVTLSISLSESLRFASYSPAGYVALETAAGLVAAIAAYIALGRFRLSGAPSDLALVAALGLLAVTTLVFFTLPAIARDSVGALAVWGQAVGTVMAAGAFALAAFVPDRAAGRSRRSYLELILGYGVSATAGLIVLYVVRPAVDLPDELPAESLAQPLVVGPPALLIWHLAAAVVFAAATVGFVRRCRERGDELTFALALAMPAAAGGAVHYFLFPSPYSGYVFVGDAYRAVFFVIVLSGVLAQIRTYQRTAERLGGRRERERLVRELHDGPVQELALLQMLVDQLASRVRDPAVRHLDERAAAALREWRTALRTEDLDGGGQPLHEAIAAVARDLSQGTGVAVDVRVGPDATVPPERIHDAVYVVREAISNAVRHAGARRIVVEAAGPDPVVIAVRDDGGGFDADSAMAGGGRGLQTMRERAAAVGGRLEILSSDAGTSVEMRVPPSDDRR